MGCRYVYDYCDPEYCQCRKTLIMNEDIKQKREEMSKESWIKNVLRIYPDKTREQAEALYTKIFTNTITKWDYLRMLGEV